MNVKVNIYIEREKYQEEGKIEENAILLQRERERERDLVALEMKEKELSLSLSHLRSLYEQLTNLQKEKEVKL